MRQVKGNIFNGDSYKAIFARGNLQATHES